MPYRILLDPHFKAWFARESVSSQAQIDKRLTLIKQEGHFGDHKCVDRMRGIWELRWQNGRRLYFVHATKTNIVLLVGGNKNGQDKDIRKAQSLYEKSKFC